MIDIFGKAALDYQSNNYTEDIKTFSSLDEEDVIPLPYLFRDFSQMPVIEQKALELCHGKILDIGCGVGSHSLYLQNKGLNTTALDISKGATDVCKLRGVKKVIQTDLLELEGEKYDTLLMLMNGIGIAGSLEKLPLFFTKLKSLLKPNGQILVDSSDIIYMFDADEDGGYWIPDNRYYGEVEFSLTYKTEKGTPFSWLYIDYNTLQRAAASNGLICELITEGQHYDYLAKLSLK